MRKSVIVAASFVLAVATATSTAQAGWGCKAVASDGIVGKSWAWPTRKKAGAHALQQCAVGWHLGCRIDHCRRNINSHDEASAIWPPGQIISCIGKGC
jgi:hypothetical protein